MLLFLRICNKTTPSQYASATIQLSPYLYAKKLILAFDITCISYMGTGANRGCGVLITDNTPLIVDTSFTNHEWLKSELTVKPLNIILTNYAWNMTCTPPPPIRNLCAILYYMGLEQKRMRMLTNERLCVRVHRPIRQSYTQFQDYNDRK